MHIVSRHLYVYKEIYPRVYRLNGGKIAEEANAIGNSLDSTTKWIESNNKRSNPLSVKATGSKEVRRTKIWSWNGLNLYPRLNSVLRYGICVGISGITSKRYYSQDSVKDRIDT